MNLIRNILLTLVVIVASNLSADARQSVVAAFNSAPKELFPLVDASARLDMVDYYDSQNNIGAINELYGRSRITEIVSGSMRIAMTSSSRYQLMILPCAAEQDTLVAVISTLLLPAADSKMEIYHSDWTPVASEKLFKSPEFKDWLTAAGRKNKSEAEQLVSFMLVSYDFDPETQILTLKNNSSSTLSVEVSEKVAPYFLDKLTYRWNGKKFVLIK